ncbi:MAG: DNA-directed RNA polymerase subunit omega [Rhodothermales bacterium]|nr:DNA-directed RNA polymerase subunit omega [Rhodothermales bacterium]
MAIKTIDIDVLANQTGNIYGSVVVVGKRARQIAVKEKSDLDNKLAYFEGFEPELEDPRFQEEQARISLDFEKRPEPTERAITEMFEGDIYYRDPSEELGN